MEIICIVCPNGCKMSVEKHGSEVSVKGNLCKRGIDFAKTELTNPTRSLTTTVSTTSSIVPVLPVRTLTEIPKPLIHEAMQVLNKITVRPPVHCGDVVLQNILDTGCDIIATCTLLE